MLFMIIGELASYAVWLSLLVSTVYIHIQPVYNTGIIILQNVTCSQFYMKAYLVFRFVNIKHP